VSGWRPVVLYRSAMIWKKATCSCHDAIQKTAPIKRQLFDDHTLTFRVLLGLEWQIGEGNVPLALIRVLRVENAENEPKLSIAAVHDSRNYEQARGGVWYQLESLASAKSHHGHLLWRFSTPYEIWDQLIGPNCGCVCRNLSGKTAITYKLS